MKVSPITLSPAFYEIHHYHVRTQTTEGDGELIGMFASLYCAAQTALTDRRQERYVRDTKAGIDHDYGLSGISLQSIVPVNFEAVNAPTARRKSPSSLFELEDQ
jgi:hypothetical protein